MVGVDPFTKEQSHGFVRVMSRGIADAALWDFDEKSNPPIPENMVVVIGGGATALSRESARLIGQGLKLRGVRFKIVYGDRDT